MDGKQNKKDADKKDADKHQPISSKTQTDNRTNIGNENKKTENQQSHRESIYKQKWKTYLKQFLVFLKGFFKPLEFATLLLFIATYSLYRDAAKSGDAAKKSADAAKEVADVAQQTLKESQREFEQTNRPYLFIANFSIDTSKIHLLKCQFEAINVGKFPATLKYLTVLIHIGTDIAHYFVDGHKLTAGQNEFLPYGGSYTFGDELTLSPLPNNMSIPLNHLYIFYDIDYEYISDVLKKDYKVRSLYKTWFINLHTNWERIVTSESETRLSN